MTNRQEGAKILFKDILVGDKVKAVVDYGMGTLAEYIGIVRDTIAEHKEVDLVAYGWVRNPDYFVLIEAVKPPEAQFMEIRKSSWDGTLWIRTSSDAPDEVHWVGFGSSNRGKYLIPRNPEDQDIIDTLVQIEKLS